MLNVTQVATSLLETSAQYQGETLGVALTGEGDVEAVVPIATFLGQVHDEATRLGVSEVAVDFRELDFMNSSCFKCFVTWLRRVQQLDTERQYRIRFLSDANKHWQRRSLGALSCFAVDLVEVDA